MPSAQESGGDNVDLNEHPDLIDMTVFEQILEMDDDGDREFSKELVTGFFEQAESTFEKMDKELNNKDLHSLSELGHFLKGSSAALGLTKIQKSCEQIQNFGKGLDASGNACEDSPKTSLLNCRASINVATGDYHEAKSLLAKFYAIQH